MKKALLIRLSSLGDVIFTTPLANCLADNGYEVTMLTSEKGADFVVNNPALTKSIVVPLAKWKKGNALSNFKEYLSILKQIRAEKYDVAIDCQRMFKSFYWMVFSGAKRRLICRDTKEFSFLGANEIIPAIQPNWERHSVHNYLQFAKHLGLDCDKVKFSLPPSTPETIAKVDELLTGIERSKPIVVIAPATTWKPKHWNPNNWKELVEKLKKDYTLIFTGMECDKELISQIGGDEHLNLAGKTNIKDLIELFSRVDLVLAPDSGSCHLARAVSKPAVIGIFTCTPPGLFAPFGDDKKYFGVIGDLKCQPCLKKKCPIEGENGNRCIDYPAPCDIMEIVRAKIGL